MGILVKSEHLKRYRDIAGLLVKYGFYDVVRKIGLDDLLDKRTGTTKRVALQGAELADDLEAMGATFVKLGQFLSTRPDVLPPEYIEALERLQTDVEEFPYEDAERIVQEELGIDLAEAFASFTAKPLAAASIGQVHRAVMHDGSAVAVKVRRPGVKERVAADLEVLGEIARFLQKHTELGDLYGIGDVFEEFRDTMLRELDYRQEKRNLETLGENLKEFPNIRIPAVIDTHTTERVLTMQFVEGKKITELDADAGLRVNAANLLAETFRAYLKQFLVDGFFHADPHPGNIVLTPDGKIGILDLGMVGRVSPGMRRKLLLFLIAMSDGDPGDAANIAESMGEKTVNFDSVKYRRGAVALVSRYQHASVGGIKGGALLLELTRVIKDSGIRVPRDLALLGKALLHLDRVASALDPEFDPQAVIREYAAEMMLRNVASSLSAPKMTAALLDIKYVLGTLPRAVSELAEQIAKNRLRIKVDAIDEIRLARVLQTPANRLTLGIVLSALIIGGAILAGTPSPYRILGLPAVTVVFFGLAGVGVAGLMIDMLYRNEKRRR
jgi:predicted unusual protein kinase regulating ubiquinone biosynthesis (AarF/ABC1/UbiB family)